MQRLEIAYSLITILIAASAAIVFYLSYHSRERSYRRLLRRERGLYEQRMAKEQLRVDAEL